MELYRKYRPKKLGELVGQNSIIKMLEGLIVNKEMPHAILLTGQSGCGKTTIARILRRELRCGKHDFNELNCADDRGIEDIRKIRRRMMQAPISGKCRIWLIDEAHKLTNDAQNALLKLLEDTPKHIYFMLATTDPQRLIRTIRTRCTDIAVKPLNDKDMKFLLSSVCKLEKRKLPKKVIEKIVEISEGSARKALVLLNQIIEMGCEANMLDVIEASVAEVQGIMIARALMNPKTSWFTMAKILKDTSKEEPESMRWMVLGYAKAVLLGGGNLSGRAFIIIEAFRDHFYDSKQAGLTAACYEVIVGIDD